MLRGIIFENFRKYRSPLSRNVDIIQQLKLFPPYIFFMIVLLFLVVSKLSNFQHEIGKLLSVIDKLCQLCFEYPRLEKVVKAPETTKIDVSNSANMRISKRLVHRLIDGFVEIRKCVQNVWPTCRDTYLFDISCSKRFVDQGILSASSTVSRKCIHMSAVRFVL